MFPKLTLFAVLLLLVSCSPDNDFLPEDLSADRSAEEALLFQEDMLSRVNEIRLSGCQCGNEFLSAVSPLIFNESLAIAADSHASDMQKEGFFAHQGSDKTNVSDRVNTTGYSWSAVGENIAYLPGEINEVIEGWKKSETHCRQMMAKQFKEMGAANRGSYWVQVFAASTD